MTNPSDRPSQVWLEAAGVFRSVFDAAPAAMLVVDSEGRILAVNRAAEPLFADAPRAILARRGGDALSCVHHFETPLGCGQAEACRSCVVRGSITEAFSGKARHRQLTRMDLREPDGTTRSIHVRVTAVPFEAEEARVVLLSLEDVTSLVQLEALLPICAWCKKVRTGESYWEAAEAFIARKLDVDVSHSICEECLEKQFPDFHHSRG
ncbi:MAG: PAS domain S-box protein [Deltaproteobacteria bacterium]|nr:PAS domain S-box protein [Deltaproteobacteria bacterium]